ncbi:MAG: hypothetical protein HYV07_10055 [Deltaproteobacteria bacterium]|nr:hypothetical protein [Deltaproteobacteria bacterium]
MKVKFKNRRGSDACLSLLNNVYFYSGNWGMSVAAQTGMNQEYWAGLGGRLRSAKDDPEALEVIIGELSQAADGAEKRIENRREIRDRFARREVVVNEQLQAILGVLPDDLIAATFNGLAGEQVLSQPCRPMEREFVLEPGEKMEQLVEPDILVGGPDQLLMIELKIKPDDRASAKYDANQLLNYLSLARICIDNPGEGVPTKFSHLIFVGSRSATWITKGDDWVRNLGGAVDVRMSVDIDACFKTANTQKTQKYIRDASALAEMLQRVPVYYRAWPELPESFDRALETQTNRAAWSHTLADVRGLAETASKGV